MLEPFKNIEYWLSFGIIDYHQDSALLEYDLTPTRSLIAKLKSNLKPRDLPPFVVVTGVILLKIRCVGLGRSLGSRIRAQTISKLKQRIEMGFYFVVIQNNAE